MTALHHPASEIPHNAHRIIARGTTAPARPPSQLHQSNHHLSIVGEVKETLTSKGYVISGGDITGCQSFCEGFGPGRYAEGELHRLSRESYSDASMLRPCNPANQDHTASGTVEAGFAGSQNRNLPSPTILRCTCWLKIPANDIQNSSKTGLFHAQKAS
jgi:hypothetical protein